MSSLPRVSDLTWERVTREFDDRGPDVCRTEVTRDLQTSNPELLDMAMRCARDVGDVNRVMTGFCMFYRLLTAEARANLPAADSPSDRSGLRLLPRVSAQTRARIVERIDAVGPQQFTREVLDELERNNTDLLRMGHNFAEAQTDYAGVMQGFALLYAALSAAAAEVRGSLH